MGQEKSKYIALVDKYKSLIDSGHYAQSKLPSTRQMAKENQVSIITARRCLVELFNAGLVYTKEGVGTFATDKNKLKLAPILNEIGLIGYRPSSAKSESNYASIYRALHEIAEQRKIHITEISIADIRKYDDPNQFFKSNGIQGNIIFGIINEPFIKSIYEYIPTVLLDSWLPSIQTDSILVDNVSLTYQLTKHLIQLDHKRIAFIGAERNDSINKTRVVDPDTFEKFAGYTMALEESNISLVNELVFPTYSLDTNENELFESLFNLEQIPTAIICCNNNFANKLLKYCEAKNISVPNDLSITTFTMNPKYLNNFITCAYISPVDFAQKALDCLNNQVCHLFNSKSKISVQGKIIKNQSTTQVNISKGALK